MSDIRAGHDSRALANQIIRFAGEQGRALTIMQLLKLAYFAHGWSLGLTGRPLSKHSVQAWQYGPVFPHIYRSLQGIGSRPIDGLLIDKKTGQPYDEVFSDDEKNLIASIVSGYGDAHAFALSNLTHEPESPWDIIFKSKGPYSEIPDELITAHFKRLASDAAKQAPAS
jgi:uncharacterized phage-associated protein